MRRALAAKAFVRTAAYDAMIGNWLSEEGGGDSGAGRRGRAADRAAALWREPATDGGLLCHGEPRPGVATARQLQGKELSYNNIADADAVECVAEFDAAAPAAVIVKHANPCGAALGSHARRSVPAGAAGRSGQRFGGIVAFNRPLDQAAARAVSAIFTEVVMAPGADEEALAILAWRRPCGCW